jgi:hypothetical protein
MEKKKYSLAVSFKNGEPNNFMSKKRYDNGSGASFMTNVRIIEVELDEDELDLLHIGNIKKYL